MRKRHLYVYSFLLSLFFLITSCKKDLFVGNDIAKPGKQTELTVSEARSYFAQTSANNRYNKRKTDRNAIFHQMASNRKVLWDKAVLTRTSKGSTVKVPIDLGNVQMQLQDVGVVRYDKLNYLMMYKDSAQDIHTEWVILIPDIKWLKGDRRVYKGKIEVGTWGGNLLKKYNFGTTGTAGVTADSITAKDNLSNNRDMLAAASGTKIIAVCFWAEKPGLAFDPCRNKPNWDGVCDKCPICYDWQCFNTTDMTPIDVDDPPVDPGGSGGGANTGTPGPIYVYGAGDGTDYAPSNCNPDPNYTVPNTPPPAGMEWVLPCGNGPTEVPLPIPASPVSPLTVLREHLSITEEATIDYLNNHGDIQAGLISLLQKDPSEERAEAVKSLLSYLLVNQSMTWAQFEAKFLSINSATDFVDDTRLSCETFTFLLMTGNMWEAGVSGLKFVMDVLGTSESIPFSYRNIYVGFPKSTAINNKTYTAGQAASLTAQAMDKAAEIQQAKYLGISPSLAIKIKAQDLELEFIRLTKLFASDSIDAGVTVGVNQNGPNTITRPAKWNTAWDIEHYKQTNTGCN